MTDHDASLRRQALMTLRSGSEEQRRVAAGYLHSEIQELAQRLEESADRAVEEMARSMFEGLDRALSRGDDTRTAAVVPADARPNGLDHRSPAPAQPCGWCGGEGALRDEEGKLGEDCPRCDGRSVL